MVVNVLFVCLGNICRSPMAGILSHNPEIIFNKKIIEKNIEKKFFVDSAGTGFKFNLF